MAKHTRPVALEFDMTPMIDIVFLLIIFFMLVSQFASQEILPMELPKPQKSQFDEKIKPEKRAVVQICLADPSDENSEVRYFLGGKRLNDVKAELIPVLMNARQRDPNYQVVIRADERVEYSMFRDLMTCIAQAEIQSVFLTATVDPDRGKGEPKP